LPVAALMCRDLRHAWPRTTRDIARLVEWEATVVGAGGRIVEGVRRMYCTGGCGVRRVEKVRRDRQGRLVREGKASGICWAGPSRGLRRNRWTRTRSVTR
jgi:hypothetical protein